MQKRLSFCFENETLDGSAIVDMFQAFVRFSPVRITKDVKTKDWKESRDIKMIMSDTKDTRFFIQDEDANYFSVSTIGSRSKFKKIEIRNEISVQNTFNEDIEFFLQRKGFISAYLLNDDYEYVQSTTFSSNMEGRGFSKEILDSISETPWQREMWGGKEYNILFNPGRSVLIEGTWLKVGWKMWFGEGFFHLVPKDRILSFPYAVETKELSNGIVYVQLFEKLEEPYTQDAVSRQWKWREWMDYGGLEKKYG